EEMRVERQSAESEPVRCFLAQTVTVIEVAHHVGRGTAAGNEQHAAAGGSLGGEPAPQTRPQVGQGEEAAAELDAGRTKTDFTPPPPASPRHRRKRPAKSSAPTHG